MPVSFTCPHCGATTLVSDQFIGQSGPCAKCGQMVTVPAPGPGAASPAGEAEPEGGGTKTLLIVLGGVGLFLLLACGLGAWGVYAVVKSARQSFEKFEADLEADLESLAIETDSSDNLQQIAMAFHAYHAANGRFPPAYTTDENGQPMHSWRVLILPYLDHQELYDRYNMEEPWDGPSNSALADQMPAIYGTYGDITAPYCDYVVVVGEETIFNGDKASGFRDVTDGTSNTILVVSTNSVVHWMEPVDLVYDEMPFKLNDEEADASISSDDGEGALVVMADGAVKHLPNSVSPDDLKALLTRAGGEVVSPDVFDQPAP